MANTNTADTEKNTPHPIVPEPQQPYSVFTPHQKRLIAFLASFAAMFSTMSSYIYYPALVPIAAELDVSMMLVNLTVTSYLVVAALAPAFMGDMGDQGGRRPIYVVMFALMIGANVGIALQRDYAVLLALRMVQSAGASGMNSAAYGVIADITTVDERGGYVGVLLLFTDIAPSLGPVIGGSITQELGWRWVFWFLVILTGSHFLGMLLFLPETQRNIVGNGSARVRGIYWSLFYELFQKRKGHDHHETDLKKPKRRYPNPFLSDYTHALASVRRRQYNQFNHQGAQIQQFSCLPILANKDSLIVILIYAVTYAVKMTLQTSLSALCIEIYELDYLAGGLIYLPSGVAGGIGSYMTGRFLDRTYRKAIEKRSTESGTDGEGVQQINESPDFPLAKTRLTGIYVLVTISALGTVGYGLALMTKTHISVMLIMQFLTGMTTASTFTMTSTLLTDLNAHRSATAQAASSIVRGLAAGGAIAAMEPLAGSVGLGWCLGIYAIVVLLELPLAWMLCR